MTDRFLISWVMENGYQHYKVYNKVTVQIVHCDEGELNETQWCKYKCSKGHADEIITMKYYIYNTTTNVQTGEMLLNALAEDNGVTSA